MSSLPPPVGSGLTPDLHLIPGLKFQAMCRDILSQDANIQWCDEFGVNGQAQMGVDLVAHRRFGGIDVAQCKSFRKITVRDIRLACEDFLSHAQEWHGRGARRFLLLFACDATSTGSQTEILRQKNLFMDRGIVLEVWGASTLVNKIRGFPGLVSHHLSRAWVDILCVDAYPVTDDRQTMWPGLISPYFMGRSEEKQSLVSAILADTREGPSVISLTGRAGIGKSTLARQAAKDPDVVRRFQDGIFEVAVGQHPDAAAATAFIRSVLLASGYLVPPGYGLRESLELSRLRLRDKRLLFILDDMWDPRYFGMTPQLPNSVYLVTSRSKDVATALGAEEIVLEPLPTYQGRNLLKKVSGTQEEQEELDDLVAFAEGLPFALVMLGSRLRRGGLSFAELLEELRAIGLTAIRAPLSDYAFTNATSLFESTLGAIPVELRAKYLELSILPPNAAIDPLALELLWDVPRETGRSAVDDLAAVFLVLKGKEGSILLHDLHRLYCIAACPNLVDLHRAFVLRVQNVSNDWTELPESGYLAHHLLWHIGKADLPGLLTEVATSAAWIRSCHQTRRWSGLLNDIREAITQTEMTLREDLQSILHLLGCAATSLSDDSESLATQLASRRPPGASERITTLIEKLELSEPGPWLRPSSPYLCDDNDFLSTAFPYNGRAHSIALSPDGAILSMLSLNEHRHLLLQSWDASLGVPLEEKPTVLIQETYYAELTERGPIIIGRTESGPIQATLWFEGLTTPSKTMCLRWFGLYKASPLGRRIGYTTNMGDFHLLEIESGTEAVITVAPPLTDVRPIFIDDDLPIVVVGYDDGFGRIQRVTAFDFERGVEAWRLEGKDHGFLRFLQQLGPFLIFQVPGGLSCVEANSGRTAWTAFPKLDANGFVDYSSKQIGSSDPSSLESTWAIRSGPDALSVIRGRRQLNTIKGYLPVICCVSRSGAVCAAAFCDARVQVCRLPEGFPTEGEDCFPQERVTPRGLFAELAEAFEPEPMPNFVYNVLTCGEEWVVCYHGKRLKTLRNVREIENVIHTFKADWVTSSETSNLIAFGTGDAITFYDDKALPHTFSPEPRKLILEARLVDSSPEGSPFLFLHTIGSFSLVNPAQAETVWRIVDIDDKERIWAIQASYPPVAVTTNPTSTTVWDLRNGARLATIQVSGMDSWGRPRLTPDRSKLVIGQGGGIDVWDLSSGSLMRSPQEHRRYIEGFEISSTGRYGVTISEGEPPHVWDIESSQLLYRMDQLKLPAGPIAFPHPDELFWTMSGSKLQLWNPATGAVVLNHNVERMINEYSVDRRSQWVTWCDLEGAAYSACLLPRGKAQL